MVIKSGSTLLVPRRGGGPIVDVSSTVADNATMILAPDAPPLRKVSLRAGKHDSVETIARRYRVSASQVAQWNDVGTGATFAAGQTVVVYVAAKGRATTRFASTVHGTKVSHSTHRSDSAASPRKSQRTIVTPKHVVAKQ